MDDDLKSIAAARRAAETAFEAYRAFLGTDPVHVDAIVDAMARAIEPEAERLGLWRSKRQDMETSLINV